MRAVVCTLFLALLAVLVPAVTAEAQASPFVVLSGPSPREVPPGELVRFEFTLSPAPEVDVLVPLELSGRAIANGHADVVAAGFSASAPHQQMFQARAGVATYIVEVPTSGPIDPLGPSQDLEFSLQEGVPFDWNKIGADPSVVIDEPAPDRPPRGRPVGGGIVVPDLTADINVFAGSEAVVDVVEGEDLKFGVFLARPAPTDVVVTLELKFAPRGTADGASPLDLAANPAIMQSSSGERFFIDVPITAGLGATQAVIPTVADMISPEGISGVERFRVGIASVTGFRSDEFSDDLELTIRDIPMATDPEPEPEPDRTRTRTRNRTPRPRPRPVIASAPSADPIHGPLVSGAITWSFDDRVVTLTLPASLRVWMAPTNKLQVMHGSTAVSTLDEPQSTVTIELPAGASDPVELMLRGRLRTGAIYTEPITITQPVSVS